jgi:colicin import membrane protein
VTTLQEHIEHLEPAAWAALTRRTTESAVAAAKQLGHQLPAPLLAVAAMTEAQLIEHHKKNSGAAKRKRPTTRMKLIEADHELALAEQRTREAEQDKEDAVGDAAAARAEAQECAAAAEAARERARAADAESARKDVQRAAERREGQAALEKLRNEVDQVRADADAEVAAAREQARAAEERAEQRIAERTAERAAGQRALEKLRAQLHQGRAESAAAIEGAHEQAAQAVATAQQGMDDTIARVRAEAQQRVDEAGQARARAEADAASLRGGADRVRADAHAEIAAAREQARAAQERAEQRTAERTAERAAGQRALEKLRAQLEQVRAEAEQRVDEAGQARARAEADAASLRAEAEAARASAAQLLTIPVPPSGVRPETRRIENALVALHQIDYVLEVGMAEEVEAQIPLDAELVCNLAQTVQGQLAALPQELGNLPAKFSTDSQLQAAASYAEAARLACGAFLRRIGVAAQQLRHRGTSPDAEVITAVISMLDDPQVQSLVPNR